MKFDFDDILITPATISEITSRKEVNVLYEDGYLPLFTAPMDTVICGENKDFFLKAGIKVIMPRTEYSDSNLENTSFDFFRAIGYPMASLIDECYRIKKSLTNPSKIVADGGFKSYSDIIKGLALGADYIMLGSILNKALESAGETYLANNKKEGWTEPGERVDQYSKETEQLFNFGTKMFKKFRGMSTKEAQLAMSKTVLKTSEGVTRMQPVEYTINGWVDNLKSYLSSAMSYTNSRGLNYFIGKVKWNLITVNSFNRFKK